MSIKKAVNSAYWDERRELRKLYRHPAAAHIPGPSCTAPEMRSTNNHNIGGTSEGIPWVMVGWRVLLVMLKNQERVSEGGIHLPDVYQSMGKNLELITGIVVAYGPGQFSFGQYVSPYWDYGLETGDPVMIETNTGRDLAIDGKAFKEVAPHDIICRLDRRLGSQTRAILNDQAKGHIEFLAKHTERAGLDTRAKRPEGFREPGFMKDPHYIAESIRSKMGKKTKAQIVVP